MKQKTKIILMLLLGALIFSVLLCTNQVQATTEVTEEYLQEILNLMPDSINFDKKEAELKFFEVHDTLYKNIPSILKKANIEYEYNGSSVILKGVTINNNKICVSVGYSGKEKRKNISIIVSTQEAYPKSKYKEIEVICTNSKDYNETDKKYVENLKIEKTGHFEISYEDFLKNGYWITNDDLRLESAEKYYQSKIKDNTITVKAINGAGDGSILNYIAGEGGISLEIYKNEVFYEKRRMALNYEKSYYVIGIPVITVPNTVADNNVKDYVINLVKPQFEKSIKENAEYLGYGKELETLDIIEGVKNTEWGFENYVKQNLPNIYTVVCNGHNDSIIIVRKEKVTEKTQTVSKADETTNIKLNTNTDVVPANTILECKPIKEGTIFNTVKTSLKKVADKFTAFDITLKSNGVKVQPNGKVQISIPVPEGYNTGKILVYRIEDNGTSTKYDTIIKDGYITFETNHFSTYVIAEEKTSAASGAETNSSGAETTPPVETPKHEKDETPKTGTVDIIGYVLAVTTLAGIGLIAIRKRK